jgi:hypothetical protein
LTIDFYERRLKKLNMTALYTICYRAATSAATFDSKPGSPI